MNGQKESIPEKIVKTLQLIRKVMCSYLVLKVGNLKFTGKILIEINCRDGGIGNVSINVFQNFNEKSIDNLK